MAPVGQPSAAALRYSMVSPLASITITFVSASWAKVEGANWMQTPWPVHASRSMVMAG